MTQPYAKGRFTVEVDSGNGYEVVLEKDNLFTNVMAQQYDLFTLSAKAGGVDPRSMLCPVALEIVNDDTTASAAISKREMGTTLATAPLFSPSVGTIEAWKGTLLRDVTALEVKPDGFVEQKFVCEFGNGIGTGSINKLRILGKPIRFVNRFAETDSTTKWNQREFDLVAPFNGLNSAGIISGRMNSLEPKDWRDEKLDADGDNYITYINCMASSENYRLIPSGKAGQGDSPTLAVSPIARNVLPSILMPDWDSQKDISEFKTITIPPDPTSKAGTQKPSASGGRICSATIDNSGVVFFAQQEGTNVIIYRYVIGSSGEYESSVFAKIPVTHENNYTMGLTSDAGVLYLTYIETGRMAVKSHIIDSSTGTVNEVKTFTAAEEIVTWYTNARYLLNDSYFDADLDAIVCVFKKANYYYGSLTREANLISMVAFPMNGTEPTLVGVQSGDYYSSGITSLDYLYRGNHPQWAWGVGSDFGLPRIAGAAWDETSTASGRKVHSPTFVGTTKSIYAWTEGSGVETPFIGAMHGVIAETNIPAFDKAADVSVKVTYVLTSRGEFESCS